MSPAPTRPRLAVVLPAVVGTLAFVAALAVLRVEIETLTWPQLVVDITGTPAGALAGALLLTALNYGVIAGYDILAFQYIGRDHPIGELARTSILASIISHNVGFALFSGGSVRYRYYSRAGVTAGELAGVIVSVLVTFWLGLLALGGASLMLGPIASVYGIPRAWATALGALLVGIVGAFLAASALGRGPVRIHRWALALPRPTLALQQLALSSVDLALAGAVLYTLLPRGDLSYPAFLASFLAAMLLGMVSHVPGGLGVFEGAIVLLAGPSFPGTSLLPSLVVFRVVYYLVPLAVALGFLLIEAALRYRGARRRQSRPTEG